MTARPRPAKVARVSGEGGGELLAVRVTPRARADRLLGFRSRAAADGGGRVTRGAGEVLLAQVTAAPEAGKANRALTALLARTAGVPRRAVQLVTGARSRDKLLRVPAGTTALLRRLLARSDLLTSSVDRLPR